MGTSLTSPLPSCHFHPTNKTSAEADLTTVDFFHILTLSTSIFMKRYSTFALSAVLILGISACSDENSTTASGTENAAEIIPPSSEDSIKEFAELAEELSKLTANLSEAEQLRENADEINKKLKRLCFLESVIHKDIQELLEDENREQMTTYLAAQLMLSTLGAKDFTPENRQLVIKLSENNVYLCLMAQIYAMSKVFAIADKMDMDNLAKHEDELCPWLEELVQLQHYPCMGDKAYAIQEHPIAKKIMELWIESSMGFARFVAVMRLGNPGFYDEIGAMNPKLDAAPRLKKLITELSPI